MVKYFIFHSYVYGSEQWLYIYGNLYLLITLSLHEITNKTYTVLEKARLFWQYGFANFFFFMKSIDEETYKHEK